MTKLNINGNDIHTELSADTPLLWLLRDELKLTATKFGCGLGQCGACTVHVNGQAVRSCITPIASLSGQTIETMEHVNTEQMTALKRQWQKHNVPQCGYCQVGQLMTASSLLNQNQQPSINEIEQAMSGNICRCGTYERIKTAILQTAEQLATEIK